MLACQLSLADHWAEMKSEYRAVGTLSFFHTIWAKEDREKGVIFVRTEASNPKCNVWKMKRWPTLYVLENSTSCCSVAPCFLIICILKSSEVSVTPSVLLVLGFCICFHHYWQTCLMWLEIQAQLSALFRAWQLDWPLPFWPFVFVTFTWNSL